MCEVLLATNIHNKDHLKEKCLEDEGTVMPSRAKSAKKKTLPGNSSDSERNVHGKENVDPSSVSDSSLSSRDVQKRPSSHTHSRSSSQGTSLTYDKIRSIKAMVEKAICEHKVFFVEGSFHSVRNALKQRGWLEKVPPRSVRKCRSGCSVKDMTSDDDFVFETFDTGEDDGERSLMWRLLRGIPPDLVWSMKSDTLAWRLLNKDQTVSRFPCVSFGTKVGLCSTLQQLYWYGDFPPADTFFPRCYNVCQKEERLAFIDDYRITACFGLLKWMISKYGGKGKSKYPPSSSSSEIPSEDFKSDPTSEERKDKIPPAAVEFALRRCTEYTRIRGHEEIDSRGGFHVWEHQWDQFLTWYYLAVHNNADISEESKLEALCESAKKTLQTVAQFWPQMDMDGRLNMWIVKPGAKSRGRGIQIKDRLEAILALLKPSNMKETRYVVQKYIECPLLIHNTKFDIRQWFLVTDWQPLTIWMYRESYLRFSSQQFSLANMHESIHLCNNAVQRHYTNCEERNEDLPEDNMWDSYTFQAYLRVNGYSSAWDTQIYPGMRQALIATLLASQNSLDSSRKNCFELFGADFMLTEDLNPWLIEINTCPCMSPSTRTTARMCGQCLEDVIKVVVDRKESRNSDTGLFELVYRAPSVSAPTYLGVTLCVFGHRVVLRVPKGHCTGDDNDNESNSLWDDTSASSKGIGMPNLYNRTWAKKFWIPRPDLYSVDRLSGEIRSTSIVNI